MVKREIRSWLTDMDGVLVHEEDLIPGANRFIARLSELNMPFLVLHEQLDLHAPGPRRPPPRQRLDVPGGRHLDLGAGDGAVPG